MTHQWKIDPWPEDHFVPLSRRLAILAESRATMDRKRYARWAYLAALTVVGIAIDIAFWIYLGCRA